MNDKNLMDFINSEMDIPRNINANEDMEYKYHKYFLYIKFKTILTNKQREELEYDIYDLLARKYYASYVGIEQDEYLGTK